MMLPAMFATTDLSTGELLAVEGIRKDGRSLTEEGREALQSGRLPHQKHLLVQRLNVPEDQDDLRAGGEETTDDEDHLATVLEDYLGMRDHGSTDEDARNVLEHITGEDPYWILERLITDMDVHLSSLKSGEQRRGAAVPACTGHGSPRSSGRKT